MSRISPKFPVSPSTPTKITGLRRFASRLYTFWKFARPHTVIGTSLSVVALYLIAISSWQWSETDAVLPLTLLSGFFVALFACLGGNVYIVGLNQLADVGIDRINKPHLPLASGEYSRQQGISIVAIAGSIALLLAIVGGPFLLATVGSSLMIGTAYSLPPIRLKRFPFWASFCILAVRGVIVNLGLYLHFSWLQVSPADASLSSRIASLPASVLALTLFVLVFTFAIAIFKDMPDTEGDRHYNISTFTLRLGQTTVFNLTRWVLTACYLGMAIAGIVGLPSVNRLFLVSFHLLVLGILWIRSMKVDLRDKHSISRFYQFIWKLFFLEYLVFPIACLLPL